MCLLPLFDPPRHDTKETIERCREKGIDVKMVTGDQLLIGKETSRQLGMGTNLYSTEALLEVRLLLSLPLPSFSFLSAPADLRHRHVLYRGAAGGGSSSSGPPFPSPHLHFVPSCPLSFLGHHSLSLPLVAGSLGSGLRQLIIQFMS